MSVAVVVDNTSFPLQASDNSILFSGEAPAAESGYHYTILKNNQVNTSESFLREPVTDENTVNEFFNRSKNTHELAPLPQVYSPLPIIDRIKSDLHIEGQIATVHLWGNQTDIDHLHDNQSEDLDIKLNMDYIGLNDVQRFEEVKVSLSGRSSRWVPKLSYTMKMKKKKDDNLYGYKNLKLRAMAMDPSYLRESTAFSSIKAAGIPATEFSYVRVFMNNKPLGLYGLIETFQDPWLASEFANGDENYKSGELYQGILASFTQTEFVISDFGYMGENITKYNMGQYKMKAGEDKKEEKGFVALKDFTKFVNGTTKDTSVDEWEKHIDTKAFLRSMALEDLLGFSDGYMTMADNYYIYSDPQRDGRMIYIPSDLDTTIGISLYNITLMTSGNYAEHPGFNFRPLTIQFFSNPDLLKEYKDTIYKLANELLSPSIINPRIDSVVDMIRQDVEWDGTLARVGKTSSIPAPSLGNSTDLGNVNFTEIMTKLFPPGMNTNFLDDVTGPQVSFDQAVNGPINSQFMESVRGFITKKVNNVLAFHNQSSS
ncbi:coth-domain-containing protein [Backusella circina FSU 941]|nr:coth-domain-containing protein [Backusella circina FSU 941]